MPVNYGPAISALTGSLKAKKVQPQLAINCATLCSKPKKGVRSNHPPPQPMKATLMLFNVVPLESLKKHGDEVSKVLNSIKGK